MQQEHRHTKPFTCLIADDSHFARHTMAIIISRVGGTVVGEAANGLDALREFSRSRPDLVLLDITMPGLDGISTLDRIMQQDKNAKVIMVSCIGNRDMVGKAVKLGARTFLVKPYSTEYASLVIGELMNGRHRETADEA